MPGPPRHVGPYRLLATIGTGGMGEVYLAHDPRPGTKLVAVKTVRAGLDLDDGFRVRFRREIAAARAVSGAGTAALIDGDADADVPWLATEFVPGPSLAETVARCGPLPVPATRALGAGLARALAAVHAAQVLHRDLKPANVLLTATGPRLIDFGIAQAFDATALTSTGLIVGTPGFLAPEQVEGSHAVVPASDVFSLGAVLCFAATGRGPFDDEEMASVVFRVVQGDADLTDVPEELREPVTACLRPAPEDRPTPADLERTLAAPKATARSAAPTGTHAEPTGHAVPWPTPVLSLFAEHREAADHWERDLARSTFAEAETHTGGYPGTGAAHPPRPRRRNWPWLVAAAAVGVAVAIGAVYVPGDGTSGTTHGTTGTADGTSGTTDGTQGTDDNSRTDRKTPPTTVTPYGNATHSGDFGTTATATGERPAGWKPWTRPRGDGMDDLGRGCVLVTGSLVCRDGKGAATALDAATGARRWTTKGFGGLLQGVQDNPPDSDGKRVFVPSALGTTAVDVASGRVVWRHGLDADEGLINLTYADEVVYSVELALDASPADGGDPAVVRARRAGDGRELWHTRLPKPQPGVPLLVRGGRVFLAFEDGGVAALSTRDGSVARRADAECDGVFGHGGSVVCWSSTAAGVRVLDADTLRTTRTLAPGRKPVLAPVVGDAGVLVTAAENTDEDVYTSHRLVGYDWRSGKQLWDMPAPEQVRAVALAGRRVLSVGAYEIRGMALSGDPDSVRTKSIPTTDGDGTDGEGKGGGSENGAGEFPELAPPLYWGGVMFVQRDDGGLISGYAP
ncbi:protein kinase [Streptomyces sp. NPDC017940]|uniref:serine/threonine-protein kinase n=1 Tax=Streptomyces sp. NPDC017940 TaxID=3365017 RepID=UPI00378C74DE